MKNQNSKMPIPLRRYRKKTLTLLTHDVVEGQLLFTLWQKKGAIVSLYGI